MCRQGSRKTLAKTNPRHKTLHKFSKGSQREGSLPARTLLFGASSIFRRLRAAPSGSRCFVLVPYCMLGMVCLRFSCCVILRPAKATPPSHAKNLGVPVLWLHLVHKDSSNNAENAECHGHGYRTTPRGMLLRGERPREKSSKHQDSRNGTRSVVICPEFLKHALQQGLVGIHRLCKYHPAILSCGEVPPKIVF